MFRVPILCWIGCVVLPVACTGHSFDSWMNPATIYHFKEVFYDLIDHNHDGQVSKYEMAIGIQAQISTDDIINDISIYELISYIPMDYSAVPSMDFVDFADYWAIKLRKELKSGILSFTQSMTQFVAFGDALEEYFGDCEDIMPYETDSQSDSESDENYCEYLIKTNPFLCSIYPNSCQISCYTCNENPKKIRGLSDKFIPRIEQPALNYDDNNNNNNNNKKKKKKNPSFDGDSISLSNDSDNCAAVASTDHSGEILFVSDIHVEPWYDVDGTSTVSRFSGADSDNMFECRDSSGTQVDCTLDGVSDPPFPLYSTSIDFLSQHAAQSGKSKTILIMGGDTQAHDYTTGVSTSETTTVPDLLSKVVDYMLDYFDSTNIFYAAGNNDGQHDEIFCSGSDPKINAAWANVLIDNKIVNNDLGRKYTVGSDEYSQTELFGETGYYIKQIPSIFDSNEENENFYVIILNTNLGASNSVQNQVFESDLSWIANNVTNGKCLVVGHHPNIVPAMIPSEYDDIVKGSFSGHVHYYQPTNSDGFAILPAVTQYSEYVGVITGNLGSDGDVTLTWDNFNQYLGAKDKVPQDDCWGYNGEPSPH